MPKKLLAGLLLSALALTAACGESGDGSTESAESEAPLAQRDPNGYEACSLVGQYEGADLQRQMELSLLAGDAASRASTTDIRESSKSLADPEMVKILGEPTAEERDHYLAQMEELAAACSAAGFA